MKWLIISIVVINAFLFQPSSAAIRNFFKSITVIKTTKTTTLLDILNSLMCNVSITQYVINCTEEYFLLLLTSYMYMK